jgi:hypothetical protein
LTNALENLLHYAAKQLKQKHPVLFIGLTSGRALTGALQSHSGKTATLQLLDASGVRILAYNAIASFFLVGSKALPVPPSPSLPLSLAASSSAATSVAGTTSTPRSVARRAGGCCSILDAAEVNRYKLFAVLTTAGGLFTAAQFIGTWADQGFVVIRDRQIINQINKKRSCDPSSFSHQQMADSPIRVFLIELKSRAEGQEEEGKKKG